MSKKVYHIVAPDTGKVVGKKHMGKLQQILYDETPKVRTGLVIQLVGFIILFFSSY